MSFAVGVSRPTSEFTVTHGAGAVSATWRAVEVSHPTAEFTFTHFQYLNVVSVCNMHAS